MASTLALPDSAFLQGGSLFFGGKGNGIVQNLGSISSSGGSVFLIAHKVQNSGTIAAPKGTAGLAAGEQVLLKDSTNDQRIFVQAGIGDVTNNGTVAAAQAELKAADGNIYALAGNNGGQIRATGTATKDGHVWLVAQRNGATHVAGDISAQNADGTGGTIETSGHTVDVTNAARLKTGLKGNWLLDPDDLTIDSGSGNPSTVSATTIATTLNGGTDVTEQTTAGGVGGSGDIFVTNNITWASANTLTLSAYRNITVGTGVTIRNNSAAGNLNLIADNTGTGTGTITLHLGSINWSSSTGSVGVFYNPSGSASTKYTNPTNYSSYVSTNGAVPGQFNPYMLVNNVTDLGNINTNLAGTYGLNHDLDASGTNNFTPIGASISGGFTGLFDGQWHTIDSLTINDSTHTDVGLFSKIGSAGIVRNLQLTTLQLTGGTGAHVGGLAGTNAGTVNQVFAQGTIAGSTTSATGGLVGVNAGSVIDSYSDTGVTGQSSVTGGLVGDNSAGTITTSYAAGPVTAGSGLAGGSAGTVTNSYYNTDTTGQATSAGGGSGLTEVQMESGLPTGFNAANWQSIITTNFGQGTRPYFSNQYGGGTPSVISGGVYGNLGQVTDHLGNLLSGGINPASGSLVNAYSGGSRLLTGATAGANGFYQLLLPNSVPTFPIFLYTLTGPAANNFIDGLLPSGNFRVFPFWRILRNNAKPKWK